MTDVRDLISRMADELDYYRQLLTDDRREVHALAVEARAAALLEQRHPTPVPVSERLPGAEDCNEMGQCWWFDAELWCLDIYDHEYTHWLPHHALPVPQP